MDFDDGGINHGVFHVWRVRAGLEKPRNNVRFDPVAVALENSVPVRTNQLPRVIAGVKFVDGIKVVSASKAARLISSSPKRTHT